MSLLGFLRRESPPAELGPIQGPVSDFWANLYSSIGVAWTPRLADRVWAANRCLQLCSQEIADMPLRFFGSDVPAWVANPDPNWFPNGIGDAIFAATWSQLAWGDSFLYVTSRYATGFPSGWTVLDPAVMNVQASGGRRRYRSGETPLNADDVIQISRDPRGGLRGTSALSAYASPAWGLVAAGSLGRQMVSGGGIPNAVLKSTRTLSEAQALNIQNAWVNARLRSGVGAPAILPPELSFEQLSFSASDLALLDVQQFDVRAIASAFSVPAFMLNMPLEGGLTYQNPETLFEVWWRSELVHIATRVQRALSARMLPRGQFVRFDAQSALAPTFQDLADTWANLVKENIVSIDEMRAAVLHLPPRAEGDALDQLIEPPSAAASNATTNGSAPVVIAGRPTVVVS